jgi:hypothetical protein
MNKVGDSHAPGPPPEALKPGDDVMLPAERQALTLAQGPRDVLVRPPVGQTIFTWRLGGLQLYVKPATTSGPQLMPSVLDDEKETPFGNQCVRQPPNMGCARIRGRTSGIPTDARDDGPAPSHTRADRLSQ